MSATVVHLTASRSLGGPERQILGMAVTLQASFRPIFLSFAEDGHCEPFLAAAREQGFEADRLARDTPHLIAARREVAQRLQAARADLLCCHGYKADLIGAPAARRLGLPVVAVSHGWTGETLRVRVFEALDKRALRRMDRVVAVSRAQAERVRDAGVDSERVVVIQNAVRAERFGASDAAGRERLLALLPNRPDHIVGAAGRLSPEKGFDVLIEAAATVVKERPHTAFVIFGEGPLAEDLRERIRARGLENAVVLAGFRPDLEAYLPHLDVFALSSFTEGLPVVVLEAMASGVPVVATAVGGVPEVVEDGVTGRLVVSHDAGALAGALLDVLGDEARRAALASTGRERVVADFGFERQAGRYADVFRALLEPPA